MHMYMCLFNRLVCSTCANIGFYAGNGRVGANRVYSTNPTSGCREAVVTCPAISGFYIRYEYAYNYQQQKLTRLEGGIMV